MHVNDDDDDDDDDYDDDDDDDNGYVDVLIIFSCVLQRHHYGISSGSVSVLYNEVIRIVVAFNSRKH